MSPAPATTPNADEVYAKLAPVAITDADLGYPLLHFIVALSRMFVKVEELARSSDPDLPAWSQALDVDRVPDYGLAFLGQFVGVRLIAGDTAAASRLRIKSTDGFKRGTPAALISAVQATLTGTKRVRLTERTSSAYTELVVTDPAETPNPTATGIAAQAAKAAGLVLTYSTSSVPLIDEGTRQINAAAGTIDAATLANIT